MKLTLKSESLAQLTADELTAVQGADAPPTLQQGCIGTILYTYRPTQCLCP